MTSPLTPRQIALIDQDNAAVNELADQIRQHWHVDCVRGGRICPGTAVLERLAGTHQAKRNALLVAALVRLAQHPADAAELPPLLTGEA